MEEEEMRKDKGKMEGVEGGEGRKVRGRRKEWREGR